MGWFTSQKEEIATENADRDRETAQQEHDRGEKESAASTLTDRVIHTIISPGHSDAYNQGWENARQQKGNML